MEELSNELRQVDEKVERYRTTFEKFVFSFSIKFSTEEKRFCFDFSFSERQTKRND